MREDRGTTPFPFATMEDRIAMVEEEYLSPSNDTLDQYRIEVVGATFDELGDQEQVNEEFSAASTVNVDNTHPYLLRYADAYAHETNNTTNAIGPTFLGVKPSAQFTEGQHVVCTGNNGTCCEAIVVKILYDKNNQPHYTTEKQTGSDNLDQRIRNGAKDENGEAPKNCVDFNTNPTTLFRSLYHSDWENAERCLVNNPEEASIWVTRFVTQANGANNNGEIRWQLLPLHLYICVARLRNKDAKAGATDEEKKKTSTLKLLTDLLLAYPQATRCTDDQHMIPLHSAIRGTSSLAIIGKLLEVDPSSVFWKDARGRNAFQLVEQIHEKQIHKQRVGSENEASLVRYAGFVDLLSDAARRVASLAPTPIGNFVQREETSPDELLRKQLLQLQNENLALRRENAELHHRAEINTRLLSQLVEKLQTYEEQRSINIENNNEIFGSKDELDEKRMESLGSLSKDNVELASGVQGDSGAYHKRLERYRHSSSPPATLVVYDTGSVVDEGIEGEGKRAEPSETAELINNGQRIFRHSARVEPISAVVTSLQPSPIISDAQPSICHALSAEEEDQLLVE